LCEEWLLNRVNYDLSDHVREEMRAAESFAVVKFRLKNPQQKVLNMECDL